MAGSSDDGLAIEADEVSWCGVTGWVWTLGKYGIDVLMHVAALATACDELGEPVWSPAVVGEPGTNSEDACTEYASGCLSGPTDSLAWFEAGEVSVWGSWV